MTGDQSPQTCSSAACALCCLLLCIRLCAKWSRCKTGSQDIMTSKPNRRHFPLFLTFPSSSSLSPSSPASSPSSSYISFVLSPSILSNTTTELYILTMAFRGKIVILCLGPHRREKMAVQRRWLSMEIWAFYLYFKR